MKNKGIIVPTRYGKGKIKTINPTYSVLLYLVELVEGKFEGDSLAITESEFREATL